MSKVQRLCYAGFEASDLEAWAEFAATVLAMEVHRDDEGKALSLRMDEQQRRLFVTEGAADDIAFIGWQVQHQAALDAIAGRLRDEGLAVTEGTAQECRQRRVQRLAWFIDPHSGIRMELAFAPKVHFQPAVHPARAFGGYKSGELGPGHVAIYVADLAAAEQFYVRALGFALSDYGSVEGVGNVAAFLHCNARHHSLALMGHPAARRKINHLALETHSLNDVGVAFDIARARDSIVAPLGRHMNDHAISFYMHTPSSWALEISAESRTIDPATWCAEDYEISDSHGGGWGHDDLATNII